MNLEEYEIMFHVEDRHWWYVALRGMIADFWRRHVRGDGPRTLDIGCGTGAVLSAVARGASPVGIDLAPEAVRFCRTRGQVRTAAASALALPFPAGSFDVVLMFDVLCHKSISDKTAPVREVWRVLRPGGVFLLNVPAYQWLHSSHDVAVHTDHRFTRGEMRRLLRACSFEILEATYWNTLLFGPISLVRLWRKLMPLPASDLVAGADGMAHRTLPKALGWERRLLRFASLPFGLSIFIAARRI